MSGLSLRGSVIVRLVKDCFFFVDVAQPGG